MACRELRMNYRHGRLPEWKWRGILFCLRGFARISLDAFCNLEDQLSLGFEGNYLHEKLYFLGVTCVKKNIFCAVKNAVKNAVRNAVRNAFHKAFHAFFMTLFCAPKHKEINDPAFFTTFFTSFFTAFFMAIFTAFFTAFFTTFPRRFSRDFHVFFTHFSRYFPRRFSQRFSRRVFHIVFSKKNGKARFVFLTPGTCRLSKRRNCGRTTMMTGGAGSMMVVST